MQGELICLKTNGKRGTYCELARASLIVLLSSKRHIFFNFGGIF